MEYSVFIKEEFVAQQKYFCGKHPDISSKLAKITLDFMRVDASTGITYGMAELADDRIKINIGMVAVLEQVSKNYGENSFWTRLIEDTVSEIIRHEFVHFICWHYYKDYTHGANFKYWNDHYYICEEAEIGRRVARMGCKKLVQHSKRIDVVLDNE